MDWYSIRYLYPEAFERFTNVMFPNTGIVSLSTLSYYDNKKLYYFFDREGVYLLIERYNKNIWNSSKKSREECELEGFFHCFKILDKCIRECE